jgi:hypothetical protein
MATSRYGNASNDVEALRSEVGLLRAQVPGVQEDRDELNEELGCCVAWCPPPPAATPRR